jgi:hypothetical protein
MPVEKETLDAIARAYVAPMTSIRGRRVLRLLAREFSRFDHVLWAVAEDGTPAILGLAEDGGVALCRTDGRGASAAVAAWRRLEGATVTTSFDLLKDSLPIVSWTIWHPSFARIAGTLTISAADLSPADRSRVTGILCKLGA